MSQDSRRVRDKWRMKEWYSVFTPPYFGELNVADIPCEDPAKLVGRVVKATLYDITGDFTHQSTKLYFIIANVNDKRANTILKGYEYSADFLRSLVRRGSSRVDGIFDVKTTDGYGVRMSIVAFAHGQVKGSQGRALRGVMKRIVEEKVKGLAYDQLCHEMSLGKLGSDVYNEAKKIAPLRHVGVRKSKLTSMPPGVIATTEVTGSKTKS